MLKYDRTMPYINVDDSLGLSVHSIKFRLGGKASQMGKGINIGQRPM